MVGGDGSASIPSLQGHAREYISELECLGKLANEDPSQGRERSWSRETVFTGAFLARDADLRYNRESGVGALRST